MEIEGIDGLGVPTGRLGGGTIQKYSVRFLITLVMSGKLIMDLEYIKNFCCLELKMGPDRGVQIGCTVVVQQLMAECLTIG